jgi:hypothetical protein
LKSTHTKDLADMREKHTNELGELKKEVAVVKTKASGLGGAVGAGGGGIVALLFQLLGGG